MSLYNFGRMKKIRNDFCEMAVPSYPVIIQELVMNSLDAQATRIEIEIDFHLQFIRVKDNGMGFSTLNHIGEFIVESGGGRYGFRGRSLYAMSKVIKSLVITSKKIHCPTRSKTVQYQFEFEKCKVKQDIGGQVGGNCGSIVTLYGVFHCFPVRLKAMNIPKEDKAIKVKLGKLSIVNLQTTLVYRCSLNAAPFVMALVKWY
jgi:DNA mismatch repair ATPase MutL